MSTPMSLSDILIRGGIPVAGSPTGIPGAGIGTTATTLGAATSPLSQSLLGRTGSALGNVYGAATGEGFGSLGFVGPRAAIGRAIPGLAFASLAPKAINALPIGSQNQRDLFGNIAAGAGIGAAVGAPFEGVGAVPGALIGGTLGLGKGLVEMFGGDGEQSSDDYKTALTAAANHAGLDPYTYTSAYDLLSKSGADKKTLGSQLANQLISDAATKHQQDAALEYQTRQRASDQQYALAMQAQAQQFFSPYVNNVITAGQSQAQLLQGQAANLPAPYRDVLLNQAQQSIGQSQRLAGAYAAQASMLPSQYMMSADLKRQQELAQLQYQQSVVNAQSGGGSGGNFAALQQQLAGG